LPACALNGGTGCIPCGTEYGAETWSVHGDIQGTPQIVTRANGASAAALLFRTLFGLVRTDHSIGTDFVPSGFVGAPNHQAEIGGSSLGARFYDARSALFFTADELVHGGVGGEQGFNPYSYAVNNPIRYMDPLGLSPDDPEVESWTDYPPFEVEITVESWSESYYDDRDLLDWLDDQDAILDDPEPVPIDLSATAPEWVTWIVDVDTEEQRLRDAAEAEELRLAARGADRFGIGVLLPKLTAAAYGINAGLTQPPQDSTQAVVLTTAQVAQGILFGAHRGGAKVFKTLAAKVGTKALYRAVGNLRAKGGIYLLVQSGVVRYVGRTKDFAARRAAHRLDPRFEGLRFKALLHTDSYAAQRGLEEVVIQAFGGPGKLANTIAGISPRSRNAAKYYRAAVRYFERYGGL
jgi:RHS repeat-associated protein